MTEAFSKAATIENSTQGFKCSGVWPVDPSVFKETDFLPAERLSLILPEANKTNNVTNEDQMIGVEETSTSKPTSTT